MNLIFKTYKDSYSGLSRSVWILSFVQFINRSGSMVLPFLSVYMTVSLGFSKTSAGVIMSVFGLGSMVGSFLGGWFTDKIGPYRVQTYSLLIGGSCYLLLPFCTTFNLLAIGVFVCAVINDSLRPASSSMVSHFSTPETTTRSFSLLRMAINLGVAIGPALAGMLAHVGYFWLFVGDGVTCIAAGFVFIYHFRHRQPQLHITEHKKGDKIQSPWRDRKYMIFILFCLMYAAAFFQIFSSIPLYYKEVYNKPEPSIGLLIALNGLIVFLFEMVTVTHIEKRYHPRTLMVIGSTMLGISFILFNLWHATYILLLAMVLMSFSEIFAMPFMISQAIRSSTDKNRGSYLAAYTIAWAVALIISPYSATQIIVRYDYNTLWYVMGSVCAITALGFSISLSKRNTNSSSE